jgi:DNA-binding transcriptional LysR family regulator
MNMQLDLGCLEALEAVVKYGGFAHASKHLHKVQSAISHQVQKLEKQLGVTIFNRDGYRVQLTPAGEAILAEGRRLLAQAEHVRSVARQFSSGWEPGLAVIVDGILPLDPTFAALRTLANEKVPTHIQLQVEFLRGVQSRFEMDNADLMLVVDYAASPYLHEEALPAIDCLLCVAPSHPLAGKEQVSLAEIQQYAEISCQRSSEEQGHDRLLFGCERAVYLSNHHAKKQALLMGVGFGWMPIYLVYNELRDGTLCKLSYVGGSHTSFTPRLVYRTDRELGRAGQRFVALLRDAIWPQEQYTMRTIEGIANAVGSNSAKAAEAIA